jgi:hypothetical protein
MVGNANTIKFKKKIKVKQPFLHLFYGSIRLELSNVKGAIFHAVAYLEIWKGAARIFGDLF